MERGWGRGAQEARHAEQLRARINECLELASLPGTSPQQRTELLTFCVVGPPLPSPLHPPLHIHAAPSPSQLFARTRSILWRKAARWTS